MDAAKPLNYAPKPALLGRSRRYVFALILTITILIGAIVLGPRTWSYMQSSYWVHRCLTYTAPPVDLVAEIINGRITFSKVPEAQRRLGVANSRGTIFLHQMRTPDGTPLLIDLSLELSGSDGGTEFDMLSSHPCDLSGNPLIAKFNYPGMMSYAPHQHWKFFAGQSDPNNPSHFTFDYELNGTRRACDAWLGNDDKLVVSERP
jgi:hypothetical protein